MNNWKDTNHAIKDIKKRINNNNNSYEEYKYTIIKIITEIIQSITMILPIDYQLYKKNIVQKLINIIKIDVKYKPNKNKLSDIDSIDYTESLLDELEFSENRKEKYYDEISKDLYDSIIYLNNLESVNMSDPYKYNSIQLLTSIILL